MEANMELSTPLTGSFFDRHCGDIRSGRPSGPNPNAARPTNSSSLQPASSTGSTAPSLPSPSLSQAPGAPRRHDRERIRHHRHVTKVGYRNRRRIQYPPPYNPPHVAVLALRVHQPRNPSQRDEAGGRSLQRRRRSHPPGAAGGTPTLPPPR
ncbi:hypothetical protein PVAP13_1KG485905 [Panicum virgatum]|uniref:Uncharacterized protein n=1 Tax=Panicum virgatum TaxID=38727 RepID=A0A8T0XVN2_PANVG|nr:hypothetical protein PVAP13_1KG485905 [Panicum virgatum]